MFSNKLKKEGVCMCNVMCKYCTGEVSIVRCQPAASLHWGWNVTHDKQDKIYINYKYII